MKNNASIDLVEDLNENQTSTSTNQLNEHEHSKLILNISFWDFVHTNTISTSTLSFNEFRVRSIIHPYIEISEIPPNFLS